MSVHPAPPKIEQKGDKPARRVRPLTVNDFISMKRTGQKIAVLTAYDFYTARLLDEIGIDGILVGDSANMVYYGEPNTLSITVDQMVYHTRAVARATKRALVIADMPFMSYQVNADEALRNAGRFLKEAGAAAVKLEGGLPAVPTVKRMIEAGIPVMGHIGLVPQSIHRFGGYAVRGRDESEKQFLLESAQALAEAGCFSIVVEAVGAELAAEITKSIPIPTIGIGAGVNCDGQVLVSNDMLGLFEDFQPKFVRRYAHLAQAMREAFTSYIADVRDGKFPGPSEQY